ncbi:MraY family glycosyltransferase [Robbsia andropogonis]|uniref:MraY family glycosyltransferase n=1 Tax=Robbsia andropogonis TaxID=28092 RepID=UPI002A6AE08E|nr:glycosyltransferase family 4 protein [Robbsia andropogonis]
MALSEWLANAFPTSTVMVMCGGAALVLGFGILAVLMKTGWAWDIATDVPNHRSMHTRPTPRVGGLGLIPACLIVGAMSAPTFRLAALIALGLALVSQIDDRRGLPARVRFAVHMASAVVFVCLTWAIGPPGTALTGSAVAGFLTSGWGVTALLILSVITFVWSMNLYNFMDGLDGLAGGMASAGFTVYAIVAFFAIRDGASAAGAPALYDASVHRLSAVRDVAIASSAVAGAAVGFMFWNAPPAKLFLGDAGSVPLGFLAASLGWLGWSYGAWPAAFPFIVFAPFACDTTVTLLRRLARGERFWEAHREHYYQRMARMGWPRWRVLLISYGAMLLTGGGAIIYATAPSATARPTGHVFPIGIIAAVLCFAGLAGLGVFIDRRWGRYTSAVETN